MRYSFFEAMVMDIIGNILWEYPSLLENETHKGLNDKQKKPNDHPEDFRARKTEKIVRAVDQLPYKPNSVNNSGKPTCLFDYLATGLKLDVQQTRYANVLDTIKTARDSIAHRASVSPLLLTDDFMVKAQFALSEFRRQLFRVAVTEYPNACSEHISPEETERPGYVIHNFLKTL